MCRRLSFFLLALLVVLPACRSAVQDVYFDARDKLGTPRRELLADRVEKARETQQEAREEFASALDAFQSVTGFQGGDLEDLYRRLNDAYERSQNQAEDVRKRIQAVEDVSSSLFREWEAELGEYEDAGLRRESERQLKASQQSYEKLAAKMERVERSMEPVLEAFQDRVLFLKHNLNARAVASLEGNVGELETDVRALLREMEASIAEADAFMRDLRG